MELYMHIPFCVQKCKYCDFLSWDCKQDMISNYIAALKNDIAAEAAKLYKPGTEQSDRRHEVYTNRLNAEKINILKSEKINIINSEVQLPKDKERKKSDVISEIQNDKHIETIYIGGGTPGLLTPISLEKILDCVYQSFSILPDAEITLETNPCVVTKEKASAYRKLGINRISMGVQSFNDNELRLLGRAHNESQIYDAYEILRNAGFSNISLDLIQGLPGQKLSDFLQNLEKAVRLSPEHISAYELIIEENTPFYQTFGPESGFEFDEDIQADIYLKTVEFLEGNGYAQYEISNYSKPGFESKHNLGYWKGAPYIGCGLGAVGYLNGVRMKKQTDLQKYIENPFEVTKREISLEERKSEFVFLGMRTKKGIDLNKYKLLFNEEFPESKRAILEKYVPNLVRKTDLGYCFTTEGFLVSNSILCNFV